MSQRIAYYVLASLGCISVPYYFVHTKNKDRNHPLLQYAFNIAKNTPKAQAMFGKNAKLPWYVTSFKDMDSLIFRFKIQDNIITVIGDKLTYGELQDAYRIKQNILENGGGEKALYDSKDYFPILYNSFFIPSQSNSGPIKREDELWRIKEIRIANENVVLAPNKSQMLQCKLNASTYEELSSNEMHWVDEYIVKDAIIPQHDNEISIESVLRLRKKYFSVLFAGYIGVVLLYLVTHKRVDITLFDQQAAQFMKNGSKEVKETASYLLGSKHYALYPFHFALYNFYGLKGTTNLKCFFSMNTKTKEWKISRTWLEYTKI